MASTFAVYLIPKSSYASPIGSDTLFGAFCWALRELKGAGALESVLNGFAATAGTLQPPFVLSSAFPFLRYGKEKIRFYAKPLVPEPSRAQLDDLAREKSKRRTDLGSLQRAMVEAVQRTKRLKKATFVSEKIFNQFILGQADAARLCKRLVQRGEIDDDDDVVQWRNVAISYGELKHVNAIDLESFSAERDIQRNEIERVALATAEGRLFFTHETFLHRERSGLWFVLQTEDLDFIKPLLRFLSDTGLGGERTVGKGQFEIPLDQIESLQIPLAKDPNCFVTLSRYIPKDDECDFNLEPTSYSLSTIRSKHEAKHALKGHLTYKRLLRVFEPGSYFVPRSHKQTYGRVVPVGAASAEGGFTAYHNGLAMPVFASLGGN
jgi:CRISPR-associated protein Csm4